MGKKARTTLTIDEDVLRKAHKVGLNVSQFCENALKEAIEALDQINTKTVTDSGRLAAANREVGASAGIRARDLQLTRLTP